MDLKSAARRFKTESRGWARGGSPQMIRARSRWYFGVRFWMVGTQEDQSLRKGMKTARQLVTWCQWARGGSCRVNLNHFPCDCRGGGPKAAGSWSVVLRNKDIMRATITHRIVVLRAGWWGFDPLFVLDYTRPRIARTGGSCNASGLADRF